MHVVLRRAGAALFALGLFASLPAVRAEDGAAKATPAAAPKAPLDMDGVLLEDGRQIEGTYDERANQRWIVTPKAGGEPLNVSVAQIVVAEKGGEVDQRGDEAAAARIWRAALRAPYCDSLEAVVSECAASSFVERAKAAMQRMKDAGAAPERIARLTKSLEGKTPVADATAEAPLAEREAAATAALVAGLDKGAAWCAKRGFPGAATSLLTQMGKLDATKAAGAAERAKALMPEGFFFKDKPDAVALWQSWADVLLPASAQFVDKSEEDAWDKLQNEPWTDGATLCFRTRNVLLFIRDMDPVVCGKALRLAEQTVRALQVFLHEGEPDVVTSDLSRLEIRIHKSRADYLAEQPKSGKKAETWSAGYFSRLTSVSHFYVDRGRTKNGAPDLEELTRVLTHEFTHHYMTARWATRFITARGATETSGGPGFWVVEGMAEFVQNQSHHLDERDPTFDDDTVLGNEMTAGAVRAGFKSHWLPLPAFVDMNQIDFQGLADDLLGVVKTKHHGGGPCSERQLWYDQAGALTYFFLQKKGPEMRRKFVQYVADHYSGVPHVPAWKYFGYASGEALSADFGAFLKTIEG